MSRNNEKKYLKPKEAAVLLSVSLSTLARWRHLGIGPSYAKLDAGSIIYDVKTLHNFVDSNTIYTNY